MSKSYSIHRLTEYLFLRGIAKEGRAGYSSSQLILPFHDYYIEPTR